MRGERRNPEQQKHGLPMQQQRIKRKNESPNNGICSSFENLESKRHSPSRYVLTLTTMKNWTDESKSFGLKRGGFLFVLFMEQQEEEGHSKDESEWKTMEELSAGELDSSSSDQDNVEHAYLPITEEVADVNDNDNDDEKPEEQGRPIDDLAVVEDVDWAEFRSALPEYDAEVHGPPRNVAQMLPRRALAASESVLARPPDTQENAFGFASRFDDIDFEAVRKVASQIQVECEKGWPFFCLSFNQRDFIAAWEEEAAEMKTLYSL